MQTSAKVAPDGHTPRRALPPAGLDGGWEAGAYGMRAHTAGYAEIAISWILFAPLLPVRAAHTPRECSRRPARALAPVHAAVHVAQVCLLLLIAAAAAKALRSPYLDDTILALLQRVTALLVRPPLHATYLSLLVMRVQVASTRCRDAPITRRPPACAWLTASHSCAQNLACALNPPDSAAFRRYARPVRVGTCARCMSSACVRRIRLAPFLVLNYT